MKLTVTFGNHLRKLWINIVFILLFLFVMSVSNWDVYAFLGGTLFLLLIIFPNIYIHFDYYSYCKDLELELKEEELILTFQDVSHRFSIQDIEKVVIHQNGTRLSRIISSFAFESYFYCEVLLKNRQKLILPCLFSSHLDTLLKDAYSNLIFEDVTTFYPNILYDPLAININNRILKKRVNF